MRKPAVPAIIAMVLGVLVIGGPARAGSDCDFIDTGDALILTDDCTTDETIVVPDGYTLDGRGNTITAVDPSGDHFRGGVVENGGASAHVEHLTVTTDGLANVGDSGADRLRGIFLDGASGSITHNSVIGINQGNSGAQEGNAIEVRNAPFDGTHPDTKTVEIAHNVVDDYQKTGIVANGDVDVSIRHNDVGASATQEKLAANSIQFGFGALGAAMQNRVDGNQWKGTSSFAGTAILLFRNDLVDIDQNNIRGNSDVGILVVESAGGTLDDNKVFDEGPDHPNSCCDVGIWIFDSGNSVTNNKVRGFDDPYVGVDGGRNKTVGGRNDPAPGPSDF